MNTGISKIIGGRYEIVTLLGEGGFSKTYLANDLLQSGMHYAVKHFTFSSTKASAVNTAKNLFQREVNILQKLNGHPNIPSFFEYVEENQEFYLIQQYIQGNTLSEKIQSQQNLEESEVIQIIDKLINILEFVHENNIIHRDIKPDNIIIDKDDNLFLIDFGAVKEFIAQNTQLQKPGTQIYTQGYAPIEQMRGYPRFNSDIYALGMTAIEALTGLEPQALTLDIYGEIVWRDKAEVSDWLANILSKMVRYEFSTRYQTVIEIKRDLNPNQSATNLVPTQAIAPSLNIYQTSNESTSNMILYTIMGVLSIVAILYAAGLLPGTRNTQPKRQQALLLETALISNV
ncbi:serine/threonine protein kinase [Calothrix sp. FACHB-1219]|uniref:serine/threonine-protein kinase n=1 Tax=unclassified Calothrix TaxID=2619626 RepID=UPI001687AFFA|nr:MULTISPECIES: serine/threonine-protein kinase [unclassified Calothrix]MBD2203923.1 serine/threonine protein kinase [Calothrix sp. FACHB-168]MBD2218292.1 serine/threonine protein kinase [Calothrix sp. FACHB-1219]